MNGTFDNVLSIIAAVFGFGILVFFHEFGHFIMGKLFKIKVEKFSLGLGPKIWGIQGKETYYQIAALPFGGFCKFKGDEILDNTQEKDPDSFYSAPAYKRLIVAIFGPFMNYIIAVIFLSILAMGSYKEAYQPRSIHLVDDVYSLSGEVKEKSPAKKAGLATSDEIISINDTEIKTYNDISRYFLLNKKDKYNIVVFRKNLGLYSFDIVPKWDPEQLKNVIGVFSYIEPVIDLNEKAVLEKELGLQDGDRIIGIDDDYDRWSAIKINYFLDLNFSKDKTSVIHVYRDQKNINIPIDFNEINHKVTKKEFYLNFEYPIRKVKGKNIFSAFYSGFKESNDLIKLSAIGLHSLIFKPKKNIQNQIGGPIMIGYFIGNITIAGFKESLYMGLRKFLEIISYISLVLAFFNLLPIPALDGGHVIMNIYEMITRRSVNLKIINIINMIFFLILILLSFAVAFLDISRIISFG